MSEKIIGFSKLSREDKINWISSNFLNKSTEYKKILNSMESFRKFELIQAILSSLESFEKPIIFSGIIFFTLCKYK